MAFPMADEDTFAKLTRRSSNNVYFDSLLTLNKTLTDPNRQLEQGVYYTGAHGFYALKVVGACANLKDGKCEIYKDRPYECTRFQVKSSECFIARKLANYDDNI